MKKLKMSKSYHKNLQKKTNLNHGKIKKKLKKNSYNNKMNLMRKKEILINILKPYKMKNK
jgi:hypothetical protein